MLGDVSDFGQLLSVVTAVGNKVPYKGYIDVSVSVPFLGNMIIKRSCLVVQDTEYNRKVPVIIGANVIRYYVYNRTSKDVPVEWQTAFDNTVDEGVPVKTICNYGIRIGPGDMKPLHGLARKTGDTEAAVAEHTNGSLSGNLTICPRVVSLKGPGSTIRVPVRVCNLSAKIIEIPPKAFLCCLKSVEVVDTWTPEPAQEQKSSTVVEGLSDQTDEENLSSEQYTKAERLLNNWSDIFSTGPTDLGKTDLVKQKINLTDNPHIKNLIEEYRLQYTKR